MTPPYLPGRGIAVSGMLYTIAKASTFQQDRKYVSEIRKEH